MRVERSSPHQALGILVVDPAQGLVNTTGKLEVEILALKIELTRCMRRKIEAHSPTFLALQKGTHKKKHLPR